MQTAEQFNLTTIRHLARHRAEHLQRAAWQANSGDAIWETVRIDRYTTHNTRRNFLRRSNPSPRSIWVPSHINVPVPALNTQPLDWPAEELSLTEQDIKNAEAIMLEHDPRIHQAWRAYLTEPEPITVWTIHQRDGLRRGFRTRIRPFLPEATLAFAIPSIEWATNQPWTLNELGGRKTDANGH